MHAYLKWSEKMHYLPRLPLESILSLSHHSQVSVCDTRSGVHEITTECVIQHGMSCTMCACVCFYLHYTERGRFHRRGWTGQRWAGRGWRRWRCSASPRWACSCTGRTCTERRRRTGALMAERQLSLYLRLPHLTQGQHRSRTGEFQAAPNCFSRALE